MNINLLSHNLWLDLLPFILVGFLFLSNRLLILKLSLNSSTKTFEFTKKYVLGLLSILIVTVILLILNTQTNFFPNPFWYIAFYTLLFLFVFRLSWGYFIFLVSGFLALLWLFSSFNDLSTLEHRLTVMLGILGLVSAAGLTIFWRDNSFAANLRLTLLNRRIVRDSYEQALLKSINRASLAVSSTSLSLKSILRIIAQESLELVDAKFVGVALNRYGSLSPYLILGQQKLTPKARQLATKIFARALQVSAKNLVYKPSVVSLHQLVGPSLPFNDRYDKLIICPIVTTKRKLIGQIFLLGSKTQHFSRLDLQKVTVFSSHAALAIIDSYSYEALKKSIKMRDQFASVTSHELKNPLTTIKLYSQMLKTTRSLKKVAQVGQTILEESDKLLELVEGLLDFSRMRTGRFKMKKELFDLSSFCQDRIKTFQTTITDHNFKLGPIAPQAIINADKIKIDQVVTNLLTNASKYSPPKTTIVLSLTRSGDHFLLSVADQGRGIPAESIKKIFEPFYQVSNTNPRYAKITGLGLGLFITKEIVKLHKGRIWVESNPGKGSVFYIWLPSAKPT